MGHKFTFCERCIREHEASCHQQLPSVAHRPEITARSPLRARLDSCPAQSIIRSPGVAHRPSHRRDAESARSLEATFSCPLPPSFDPLFLSTYTSPARRESVRVNTTSCVRCISGRTLRAVSRSSTSPPSIETRPVSLLPSFPPSRPAMALRVTLRRLRGQSKAAACSGESDPAICIFRSPPITKM